MFEWRVWAKQRWWLRNDESNRPFMAACGRQHALFVVQTNVHEYRWYAAYFLLLRGFAFMSLPLWTYSWVMNLFGAALWSQVKGSWLSCVWQHSSSLCADSEDHQSFMSFSMLNKCCDGEFRGWHHKLDEYHQLIRHWYKYVWFHKGNIESLNCKVCDMTERSWCCMRNTGSCYTGPDSVLKSSSTQVTLIWWILGLWSYVKYIHQITKCWFSNISFLVSHMLNKLWWRTVHRFSSLS